MNRFQAPIVALLVVFAPLPALGQGARGTAVATGFRLYSSRVTAGFDDQTVTDELGSEGNVLVFAPTAFAYNGQAERSSFQFIYEPEFEIFQTRRDLNSWNHAAGVMYQLQVTRDLSFRIGGTFLQTQDRTRQSSGLAASQRGLYLEGRSDVGITYRFSRETRLNVGVNSWLTRTAVPPSRSATEEIDEWRNSLSLRLSRTFSQIHELSVRYTRLQRTVLNPEDLPEAARDDRDGEGAMDVGYNVTVRPGMRIGGSVGAIRLPSDAGTEYTYAFSGQAEKRWTSLALSGGYRRTLSGMFRVDEANLADGIRDPLLNRGVAESANVRLSGQVERFSLDQTISVSRTDVSDLAEPIESFLAAAVVGFSLTERVVPLVTIAYWDQNSSDPRLDFQRTRVTAGFVFYWDPPPTPQYRADYEAVRSLLPTRGGR